jgi:hypothetical protein
MPEALKFKKPDQNREGDDKVRKFFDLNSFYYPDDKTIVVHEGEYELSFSVSGEALKMSGAAKHARAGDGNRVPETVASEARKKAYVVLKIINGWAKKKADEDQLDLFKKN